MLESVLIANRGEIARRILRTCRKLGVRTVAVQSETDANALHVEEADAAFALGGQTPADSYLHLDKLLDAAQQSGVQAVHPGYGFLSENAEFAKVCAEDGLVFIGPAPEVITSMGRKDEAKRIMAEAGVPVVPGYHGDAQEADALLAEAERIGWPVLIKAVAGGGGKGMRVVESAEAFPDALQAAQREGAAAFGDGRVLLERYVAHPRHIEVQILADQHGNALHLFERECSLQRRHQKVWEEAPSVFVDDDLRERITAAAVAAGKAVGYTNAGTVEFLVGPDREFYFMEMNTRLQVEHPVTEMITGLDLVEWQLRIAAGEKLPVTQEQVGRCGHAIEVRLYAEQPEQGFLPSTGVLERLEFPGTEARLESGVREGDAVSVHYDPMLAKLIVLGRNRAEAVRKMRGALQHCGVAGLHTNLRFLEQLSRHPVVAAGEADTLFIESQLEELLGSGSGAVLHWCAALHQLRRRATHRQGSGAITNAGMASVRPELVEGRTPSMLRQAQHERGRPSYRPQVAVSPWERFDNWRLFGTELETVDLQTPSGEVSLSVEIGAADSGSAPRQFTVLHEDTRIELELQETPQGWLLTGPSLRFPFRILEETNLPDAAFWVIPSNPDADEVRERFTPTPRLSWASAEDSQQPSLTAPMPGTIVQVHVSAGETVRRGQPLLTLEAMKMEHTLSAPEEGVVDHLLCAKGDLVEAQARLVEFRTSTEGETPL